MNEPDVELALQGGKIYKINQHIAIKQYLGNQRLQQNYKCVVF